MQYTDSSAETSLTWETEETIMPPLKRFEKTIVVIVDSSFVE